VLHYPLDTDTFICINFLYGSIKSGGKKNMEAKNKKTPKAKYVLRHNGRDKQPLNEVVIEDLWHIAQAIKEGKELTKQQREEGSEAILDVWALAHDLKRTLEQA
jgi:hypothetical protein